MSWVWVALTVAVSVVCGFVLGRVRRVRVRPAPEPDVRGVLDALAAQSAPLDLLPGGSGRSGGLPPVRCVLRSVGAEGLACGLVEGGAASLAPGCKVTCFFAPHRVNGRRVSAFASHVAEVDVRAVPPLLRLALPEALVDLPRRRHARKRVSDQRFVRVGLWLADWETSRRHFPESSPDVWVNAYDDLSGGDNAVVDVSAGGLALQVRAGLVPKGLAPGSPVVLRCSFFHFSEKSFRSHWCAGVVRAVDASAAAEGAGGVRIAVAFVALGRPDEDAPQGVVWERRTAVGGGAPAA